MESTAGQELIPRPRGLRYRILRALHEGWSSPDDLCRVLRISRSNLNRHLHDLRGPLVSVSRAREGAVPVTISLTELGRQWYKELRALGRGPDPRTQPQPEEISRAALEFTERLAALLDALKGDARHLRGGRILARLIALFLDGIPRTQAEILAALGMLDDWRDRRALRRRLRALLKSPPLITLSRSKFHIISTRRGVLALALRSLPAR